MSAALRPPVQTRLIVMALAAIALLALLISRQNSESPLVLLFLVGSLLGIALYHSLFGFTGAFRMLLAEQRSAGFRAQMVMLGGACLLFFPALASGNLFGQPVEGFVSPLSISVVIGSFLFGIGMQLGGGCASGTLFTVGGGSTRMLVTLLFFILGAMLGLTHLAWWKTLPAMAPASMIDLLGWPAALLVNISVFALAYTAAARSERLRYGSVESIADKGKSSWLRGPWPLLAGALALALLNFTTLYLAGRPWGITSAFALWGGSVLQSVGVPVGSWSGFDTPAMQNALAAGPLGTSPRSWISALCSAPCWLRDLPENSCPCGGFRCRTCWPASSAACCSVTDRASLMAAISALSSAASRPAVCTAGSGSCSR